MVEIEKRLLRIPVKSWDQVETMRQIYNECLPYLSTKSLPHRTPEDQLEWWEGLDHSKVKAFLYAPKDMPDWVIGFSMVQWKPDKITPIFGITENARGNNFAREIIQHYLEVAGGPLHGEVLATHDAILRMNFEAGWVATGMSDGVVYMYHPNPPKEYPDYAEIVRYHCD